MTLQLLTGSVGCKGTNNKEDVALVQEFLNVIPNKVGGPQSKLAIDGVSGQKTEAAIQAFQICHFGWKIADGRIDVGGQTMLKLFALIGQLAPILLQTKQPKPVIRRNFRIHLKNGLSSIFAGQLDFRAMNIITYTLRGYFGRIIPRTKQFGNHEVGWWRRGDLVTQDDLLVYFFDGPTINDNRGFTAGGFTFQGNNGLTIQVYAIELSQRTLRPPVFLAKLAFHEMMHGRLDVGPTPRGVDPRNGTPITDIHKQGGGGLADFPTSMGAELNERNIELMAHNLHRSVRLDITRL